MWERQCDIVSLPNGNRHHPRMTLCLEAMNKLTRASRDQRVNI